jgi:hypothetical protein
MALFRPRLHRIRVDMKPVIEILAGVGRRQCFWIAEREHHGDFPPQLHHRCIQNPHLTPPILERATTDFNKSAGFGCLKLTHQLLSDIRSLGLWDPRKIWQLVLPFRLLLPIGPVEGAALNCLGHVPREPIRKTL